MGAARSGSGSGTASGSGRGVVVARLTIDRTAFAVPAAVVVEAQVVGTKGGCTAACRTEATFYRARFLFRIVPVEPRADGTFGCGGHDAAVDVTLIDRSAADPRDIVTRLCNSDGPLGRTAIWDVVFVPPGPYDLGSMVEILTPGIADRFRIDLPFDVLA